jgi:hypothetical protein
MDFFFPDSQDQIDPIFDFRREASSPDRVRQRDDHYAHEVIRPAPYTGILLSKALVDGPGRYTFAQRHRLFRLGVRRFFRLDSLPGPRLATLGDCGAFAYVREDEPPYTVDEVFSFYDECGFDFGISVDHVILGFQQEPNDPAKPTRPPEPEWVERQQLTLQYAAEFLRLHRASAATFEPLGVAQGWSPSSYAYAVKELQKIGYRYIALGGMVPLKTVDIVSCLKAIADVRRPKTSFHLLGVTRTERVNEFNRFGVRSFDSTSPFRQSFKDARDNYYAADRNYVALRVMQIDGNLRVKRRVLAGELDQGRGRILERACLDALSLYGVGETSIEAALGALAAYNAFLGEADQTADYRETLEARPWEDCGCEVCQDAGIQVVIFRGTERNKRRGFHNLHVFNGALQRELALAS